MNRPLVGVPVKAFGVAKERLSSELSATQRRRLGQALAARTVETITEAGLVAAIVAADEAVSGWARNAGIGVVEQVRPGLNGAAHDLVLAAAGPWAIVFADLPLLRTEDIEALERAMQRGPVIGPSRDGGTNALAASGSAIDFSYGPGSFHRHLHVMDRPEVVVRTGLALDLDNPDDLAHARRCSPWLDELLAGFGAF